MTSLLDRRKVASSTAPRWLPNPNLKTGGGGAPLGSLVSFPFFLVSKGKNEGNEGTDHEYPNPPACYVDILAESASTTKADSFQL